MGIFFRLKRLLIYTLLNSFVNATSLRDRLQRNARAPPLPAAGGALPVRAGIYIESLGKFQSTEMVHYQKHFSSAAPKAKTAPGSNQVDDFEPMSFDVDLYLYLSWKDPDLNHSNPEYVMINDPIVREQIWLPDLYFTNARTSKFHEVTVPNFNLFIAQDGTVAYSSRITLNVACNLNLVHYPMDRQRCAIRTVSYAYIEKQINVSWFADTPTTKAIRYNPAIGLPEFNILRITPSYCNGTYQYAIMDHSYKIACMFFIFLSLVEFAAVNSYMRQAEKFEKIANTINDQKVALPESPYELLSPRQCQRSPNDCNARTSAVIAGVDHSASCRKDTTEFLFHNPHNNPTATRAGAGDTRYCQCAGAVRDSCGEELLLSDVGDDENATWTVNCRSKPIPPVLPRRIPMLEKVDDAILYRKPNGCPAFSETLTGQNAKRAALSYDEPIRQRMDGSPPFKCHTIANGCRNRTSQQATPSIQPNQNIRLAMVYSTKGLLIDKWSRVGFPGLFGVFNVFYWIYYLWYIQEITE